MKCDNPIFVVGAPRSGTTLLRSILDGHPNICCPTWETGLFDSLAQVVGGDFGNNSGLENNSAEVDRNEVIVWMRQAADDLLDRLTGKSNKKRWGEKTPSHVYHLELISEVYPQAQFLHIIRDGRQVVKSLQNVSWSPRKIRWSVERWRSSVEAGKAVGEKLPDWQYLEIRYEDITGDPETTLKKMCEFLNEPFSDEMISHDRAGNKSRATKSQSVAIQSAPINQYRNLNLYERLILKWRAGDLLRDLEYLK